MVVTTSAMRRGQVANDAFWYYGLQNPESALGQKAKYPLRADVFRFGPESGLKTDIA